MSGGGGGADNVTQTQKIELPGYAKPYAKQLLQRAGGMSLQPYTPYEGQRIAPMTGEHEAGLDAITNRALYGSPDVSAARGNMANTLAGTYMNPDSNPWLRPMMDRAASQITDAYKKGTAAQLDRAASAANAFGGSAYQEQLKDNETALAQELGAAANELYYKNYGDERMAQQRAMTLAPQMGNLDYQDAQALLGVGDVRRQYGQDVLNQNYANWLDAQQDPYRKLDILGNAISGAVGGGGTITTSAPNPYQPNPAAGMLGGGLLGYGLSQQMDVPNWMGAAGGALLGGMSL